MPTSLKQNVFYGFERIKSFNSLVADLTPSSALSRALDVFRVGLWFEHLRWRLGACSAYSLGRLVQPSTYKRWSSDQEGYHHNSWAQYAKGRRIPGLATRRAADRLVPNASQILESVLWEVLDVEQPLAANADPWIRRLSPVVQTALYETLRKSASRRRTVGKSLHLLENQAIGLDGVAGTVLLLREAQRDQDAKRCLQIGISLHATLLMACSCCPLSRIDFEMIAYLVEYVFPFSDDGYAMLDVDVSEFRELAHRFSRVVLMLEDEGLIKAINAGSTREWRKVLTGHFGVWLRFAFAPRLKLSNGCALKCPRKSSNAELRINRSQMSKQLALDALRGGDIDRIAPMLSRLDSLWS